MKELKNGFLFAIGWGFGMATLRAICNTIVRWADESDPRSRVSYRHYRTRYKSEKEES